MTATAISIYCTATSDVRRRFVTCEYSTTGIRVGLIDGVGKAGVNVDGCSECGGQKEGSEEQHQLGLD